MASYESYLKELGHTTDNVITEIIVPRENNKKSLEQELEKRERENHKLSMDIKNQISENNRLKEQLAIKER